MGVGKGTTARALSDVMGKFNIDCDDLIESSTNLKITEIFEKYGEEHFRKLEKNLAKFLIKNVQNAIISTGGGFVNVKNLNKIGSVIYLKSSFEYIISRLKASENSEKKFKKRPLLQDLKRAQELFKTRDKIYKKKADFIVNVENKSPKKIAKEIKNILKEIHK